MKKNVVVIVVDSLSKKIIDEYPFKDELFLTKLEKRSTIYTRMYSNGPFTEAAMNGLFAGRQNDEYGSYLYGYDKCPSNLFYFFESQSYNMYASGIMDTYAGAIDSTRDYIRHTTYYPILDHLSYTRFVDYQAIFKERGYLTSDEINACKNSIKVALLKAVKYSVDYLSDSPNSKSLKGVLDKKQVRQNLIQLLDYCEHLDDDFVLKIVEKGVNEICPLYDTHFDYSETKNLIVNQYFSKLLSLQRKHEPSLGKESIRKEIVEKIKAKPSLANIRSFFGLHYRVHRTICDTYRHLKANNFINTKVSVSFRKRIDDILDFINNNKEPFFIYVQPQDFHPTSTFFSYDIGNEKIIRSEMEAAYNLAKRIPKSKKCNIFPFLSLRYMDEQINRLFAFLEDKDLLDNTVFVVTADHGTWEYYDTVRRGVFGLMVEERSLVPCYLFNTSQKPLINSGLISNSSFPNILLDYCGFKESNVFADKYNHNDYIIGCNFRFGTPDPFIKPCQYVVWYKHYKYIKNISLVNHQSTSYFYDLSNDKYEMKNEVDNQFYSSVVQFMDGKVDKKIKELKIPKTEDYYSSPLIYDNIFSTFINKAKKILEE